MATARERVAGAKAQLLELRKARDAEIRAARESIRTVNVDGQITDAETQTMTQAGMERRKDQLAEQVRERYRARFEQLDASVRQDTERLQREAQESRPKLGEDAVSLQRAELKWQGVRARLDAGMSPSQILASADRDTALALSEWGPAWLEAKSYESRPKGLVSAVGWEAPDGAALGRAVDARLAELDDGFRSAHQAAVEAEGIASYVAPLVANAAAPSRPGSGLQAALEAHYGEQGVQIDHGIAAADPAGGDADGSEGAA